MALEEEIVVWAATRPWWQSEVLRRVARGGPLATEELRDLAKQIVKGAPTAGQALTLDDFPRSTADLAQVRILSLGALTNVNALTQQKPLTFSRDGITVVYGDNASGKSGYARLLKGVVRSRHREDVLPDVFAELSGEVSAEITVDLDGAQKVVAWPKADAPELVQIGFYDEACGNSYIATDTEVSYRPHALFVLDGLIAACDGIRGELDQLLALNARGELRPPSLPPQTPAASFLASLSARTTDTELNSACIVPNDIDAQIAQLGADALRLTAVDPARERARIEGLAARLDRLRAHLAAVTTNLDDSAIRAFEEKRRRARDAKAAALLASAMSFEREPVQGVGSASWKTLWQAARAFAQGASPPRAFPDTAADARCLLCHQPLDRDAVERMERFDAFVRDETQRNADAAERELSLLVEKLRSLVVLPPEISLTLDDLPEEQAHLARAYRSVLASYEDRLQTLLVAATGEWMQPSKLEPTTVSADIQTAAERLRATAQSIELSKVQTALAGVIRQRQDLEANRILAEGRPSLEKEIARLRERAVLEEAKRSTDTTGISRKSGELTRAHVTTLVRDRFTRESDRLRLERVTLEDVGAQKGRLRHRPAFVGVRDNVPMGQVLSEGEQTALGLAGFFTEVYLDATRSAVVLDDPVSSLDHIRRGAVADRLAALGKERQVIVFTHDISFAGDIRIAADREGVSVTERAIERRGDGRPGTCLDAHPWKVRDVKQRLEFFKQELSRLRREAQGWNQEQYEKETSDWAGRLSETWERLIRLDVVGRVVERSTQEVRPKMFRLLARITEADDKEFQESYGRCSRWARRHDKSPELNYTAPTLQEMEGELTFVRSWFDRIKKYGDS